MLTRLIVQIVFFHETARKQVVGWSVSQEIACWSICISQTSAQLTSTGDHICRPSVQIPCARSYQPCTCALEVLYSKLPALWQWVAQMGSHRTLHQRYFSKDEHLALIMHAQSVAFHCQQGFHQAKLGVGSGQHLDVRLGYCVAWLFQHILADFTSMAVDRMPTVHL